MWTVGEIPRDMEYYGLFLFADVAPRFAETWLDKLPVVDADGRLQGTIAAADVLRRGRF